MLPLMIALMLDCTIVDRGKLILKRTRGCINCDNNLGPPARAARTAAQQVRLMTILHYFNLII